MVPGAEELEAPEAEKRTLMRICPVRCEKVVLKDSSPSPLRKGLSSFLKDVDPL